MPGTPPKKTITLDNLNTFYNCLKSEKGKPNGFASLDSDGKILASQLSEEVADVTREGEITSWDTKTWDGYDRINGYFVWTDGDNIYLSGGTSSTQYVLDKTTNTWSAITWNGYTDISGPDVWTDGNTIYYSSGSTNQYELDKTTNTWSAKTWNVSIRNGSYIWTDNNDIYYSDGSTQYILDKSTGTWNTKTWNGLTSLNGYDIWTDGTDIYYSNDTNQYVLDRATSTWSIKTWNGLTNFWGRFIWIDNNIYYSESTNQYILDKATSTWSVKTWDNLPTLDGRAVWSDEDNTYYSTYTSSTNDQFILTEDYDTVVIEDAITINNNGDIQGAGEISDGLGNTLSNKVDASSLGTAAYKNIPSSGNASTSQVVMGNDTRLSDARTPKSHTHTKSQITDFPSSMPASDVYAWAKASTKPSYTASEVGAIATSAKGAANGVASLGSDGKVPNSQLPSSTGESLTFNVPSGSTRADVLSLIYSKINGSKLKTGSRMVFTRSNGTYEWLCTRLEYYNNNYYYSFSIVSGWGTGASTEILCFNPTSSTSVYSSIEKSNNVVTPYLDTNYSFTMPTKITVYY